MLQKHYIRKTKKLRPVRRGGSLGANEPPFEMSFGKNNKATTVNELSFYNR